MSEDQKMESAAESDESPAPDATGSVKNQPSEETTGIGNIARSIEKANPVVLLLFLILIMIVALAVISLRGNSSTQPGISSDDPLMAGLKADLEARRSELNRQRMAMGLPPLEGASEPIEDIASRVKNDTETLVGLAGRFQQMLADKDMEISRLNSDMLRLEKLRQDISMENQKLQLETGRAQLSAAEAGQLKRESMDMQAQRDALALELSDTRAKLAEAAGSVNAQDFEDLQRRYDETLRSKAFFENRVSELEQQLREPRE